MKWIRVIDELPKIPKGKYGVNVLVAIFDPCFDEISPGNGYVHISTSSYSKYKTTGKYEFLSLEPGIQNDTDWVPFCDAVTHWMYLPEPPDYDPKVLNPILKHYHENSYPQTPLKQIGEMPYLFDYEFTKICNYNPNYGDDRICECGHPYYRHFDTYENMKDCGCKYCACNSFREKTDEA